MSWDGQTCNRRIKLDREWRGTKRVCYREEQSKQAHFRGHMETQYSRRLLKLLPTYRKVILMKSPNNGEDKATIGYLLSSNNASGTKNESNLGLTQINVHQWKFIIWQSVFSIIFYIFYITHCLSLFKISSNNVFSCALHRCPYKVKFSFP